MKNRTGRFIVYAILLALSGTLLTSCSKPEGSQADQPNPIDRSKTYAGERNFSWMYEKFRGGRLLPAEVSRDPQGLLDLELHSPVLKPKGPVHQKDVNFALSKCFRADESTPYFLYRRFVRSGAIAQQYFDWDVKNKWADSATISPYARYYSTNGSDSVLNLSELLDFNIGIDRGTDPRLATPLLKLDPQTSHSPIAQFFAGFSEDYFLAVEREVSRPDVLVFEQRLSPGHQVRFRSCMEAQGVAPWYISRASFGAHALIRMAVFFPKGGARGHASLWASEHQETLPTSVFWGSKVSPVAVQNLLIETGAEIKVFVHQAGGQSEEVKKILSTTACSVADVSSCRALADDLAETIYRQINEARNDLSKTEILTILMKEIKD